MAVVILDEVTFLTRVLSDNWASASNTLYDSGSANKKNKQ